jgi:hypothetical protein
MTSTDNTILSSDSNTIRLEVNAEFSVHIFPTSFKKTFSAFFVASAPTHPANHTENIQKLLNEATQKCIDDVLSKNKKMDLSCFFLKLESFDYLENNERLADTEFVGKMSYEAFKKGLIQDSLLVQNSKMNFDAKNISENHIQVNAIIDFMMTETFKTTTKVCPAFLRIAFDTEVLESEYTENPEKVHTLLKKKCIALIKNVDHIKKIKVMKDKLLYGKNPPELSFEMKHTFFFVNGSLTSVNCQ